MGGTLGRPEKGAIVKSKRTRLHPKTTLKEDNRLPQILVPLTWLNDP